MLFVVFRASSYALRISKPTLTLAIPFFMPGKHVLVLHSRAPVQDDGDFRGAAESLQVLEVQARLSLGPVAQGSRNGSVDVADGNGEPVATGLPDEPHRLIHLREALPRGKELLVGRKAAHAEAEDGSQLRLAGNGGGVSDRCNLFRGGNVLLQGEVGSVDHDRVEPERDCFLDERPVLDLVAFLVHHRDVVQVRPHVARVRAPAVLLHEALGTFDLEGEPLDAGHLDEGKGILIRDGAHYPLHHRRERDVECPVARFPAPGLFE